MTNPDQVCRAFLNQDLHIDESNRQLSTALSLSVTPAEGISNEGQPLTFFTHDIHKLRSLVAEYKRLKQFAGTFLVQTRLSLHRILTLVCT